MRRVLFLTLVFFVSYINYSQADTAPATPTEYIVTIHKVELYNSTTGSWVTVGEGDLTFDIASANAGGVVGSYASGAKIPEGVYTRERTTVSMTFYITASGTVSGIDYYTGTGNTTLDDPAGLVVINANTTGPAVRGTAILSQAALLGSGFTVTSDGNYFYHEGDLPSPITVKKGLTKKFRIKFDVTNAVEFNDAGGGICYPESPTVTFEVVD